MSSSRSNFVLKASVTKYDSSILNTKASVTKYDSSIPQNRLPLEENILRAFLYFSANALSNSLPGQLKPVNWDSA